MSMSYANPALPAHLLAYILAYVPCSGGVECGCDIPGALCLSDDNPVMSEHVGERFSCKFQRTLVCVDTAHMRAALKFVRRREPRNYRTHPNDKRVLQATVAHDGLALRFASPRLRDDADLVRMAMVKNVYALKFASPRLQDDAHIVRAAVAKDGWALVFASPRLRDDAHIVRAAHRNLPPPPRSTAALRGDSRKILHWFGI